mmetsp:Transcript_25348/g.63585  ORF Transcript_25348/g.63585 Transcript_25348/m.63585 type:complete len:157 (-) Transcript_25348:537-1007(-)
MTFSVFLAQTVFSSKGGISEAIRDFESLKGQQDVQLASLVALIYAHKKSRVVDSEAVNDLQNRVEVEERTAPERSLLQAAMFFWHIGEHKRAREQVIQILEVQPDYAQATALLGWIDLTSGRESLEKKCQKYFDQALSQGAPQLFLLLIEGHNVFH